MFKRTVLQMLFIFLDNFIQTIDYLKHSVI